MTRHRSARGVRRFSLGRGNNPKTAVAEFLKTNSNFVVDYSIDEKLLISAAPGGYLKRVK